jgi:hypothetical protein
VRYHVTLNTRDGRSLTMGIRDTETLESTLRWIERLRKQSSCAGPVLYWVTLEGYHWCLDPTDLVGDVQVQELQSVEAAAS